MFVDCNYTFIESYNIQIFSIEQLQKEHKGRDTNVKLRKIINDFQRNVHTRVTNEQSSTYIFTNAWAKCTHSCHKWAIKHLYIYKCLSKMYTLVSQMSNQALIYLQMLEQNVHTRVTNEQSSTYIFTNAWAKCTHSCQKRAIKHLYIYKCLSKMYTFVSQMSNQALIYLRMLEQNVHTRVTNEQSSTYIFTNAWAKCTHSCHKWAIKHFYIYKCLSKMYTHVSQKSNQALIYLQMLMSINV